MTNFNFDRICRGLFKLINDKRLTREEQFIISSALEIIENQKRANDVTFKGF